MKPPTKDQQDELVELPTACTFARREGHWFLARTPNFFLTHIAKFEILDWWTYQ